MTHISTKQLSEGLLIVCDGGARNNQSPDREGYGSFMVFRNGDSQLSTYCGLAHFQHEFELGNVTNNVSELLMLEHALLYTRDLIGRGWKDTVRIGTDSQTALLGATTRVKKPAKHLVPLYHRVRDLALELKEQVQFIKLDEQDVKRVLGH
jgi:ribonuclease HI